MITVKNLRTNKELNIKNYTAYTSQKSNYGEDSKSESIIDIFGYDIPNTAFEEGDKVVVVSGLDFDTNGEYTVKFIEIGSIYTKVVLIKDNKEINEECTNECASCYCCDGEDEEYENDTTVQDELDKLKQSIEDLKDIVRKQSKETKETKECTCKDSMPKYRVTIESDGNIDTIAALYIDGELVDASFTKRHPEDAFNLEVGAMNSISRLFGKDCKTLTDTDNDSKHYIIGGK